MQDFLMQRFLSLRQRRLVQITQKTLVSVFPFLLLATILVVLAGSLFSETGFINSLFGISDWLPYFNVISRVIGNMTYLLAGIMAPLVAYFAAKYTAGSYGRSTGTAGISAFLFSLIINSRELFATTLNDGALTRINLAVTFNYFVAIIIGFVIGQLFRLSNPLDDEIVDTHFVYRPRTVFPIGLTLLLGVVWNGLITLGTQYNVFTTIRSFFESMLMTGSGLFQVLVNTFLRSLSTWIGNSSPYVELGLSNDGAALSNLNKALETGSTQGIPYLFSDTNLYAAYGAVAGLGGSLALLVALLMVSQSRKNQSIAIRSIFPALFNHGSALMYGVPILFNVLYLIPFLLIPVINVLLAAVLLYFRLVPPAVYPVPSGTPSLLYAFIGTAGSLRALLASLFLFGLDVCLYIPFVRFDNRLHDAIHEQEGGLDEQEN